MQASRLGKWFKLCIETVKREIQREEEALELANRNIEFIKKDIEKRERFIERRKKELAEKEEFEKVHGYKCPFCEKRFPTKRGMKTHRTRTHGI